MSTQHHMNLTDTFPIAGLTVEIWQTVYGYEYCDKFPLEGRPQYFYRCHNPQCVGGGFDLDVLILSMKSNEISFGCAYCFAEFIVKLTPRTS
jgi:aspartate carbamoyltransferase regulatory subunit